MSKKFRHLVGKFPFPIRRSGNEQTVGTSFFRVASRIARTTVVSQAGSAVFFEQKGAKLIAPTDSQGTIYDPGGIPVADLDKAKAATGSVLGYFNGRKLALAGIFGLFYERSL